MYTYPGKLDKKTADYHPAIYHIADVAAVTSVWLDMQPNLLKQFEDLAGCKDICNLLAFFSGLHDLGKIDVRFYNRMLNRFDNKSIWKSFKGLKDLNDSFSEYYHGNYTYSFLNKLNLPFNKKTLEFLARATGSHHGTVVPKNFRDIDYLKIGSESKIDTDNRKNFTDDFLKLFCISDQKFDITLNAAFFYAFAGLVSVSDWIGSSFQFNTNEYSLKEYYDLSLNQSFKKLTDIGIISKPKRVFLSFQEMFGFEPRLTQKTVIDSELNSNFIIVEDETGTGKTETALYLAQKFLSKGSSDKIYFALPTQATSNLMYQRLEEVVTKMFDNTPMYNLARGGFKNDNWANTSKKNLLANIAIGTVDQLLLSVLSNVKHNFIRMFSLLNTVVIFDEIHAYDIYTNTLIFKLLNYLGKLKVPVIILSATLTESQKYSLLKAYRDSVSINSDENSFPLVTYIDNGTVNNLKIPGKPLRKIPVKFTENFLDIFKDRSISCGYIRNTVKEAQEAFDILNNADAVLIHSRFRRKDRTLKENYIKECLGENLSKRIPIQIIATQVLEQSLNIDFDILGSDPAPVDLLFQRSGRLQRFKHLIRKIDMAFHIIYNDGYNTNEFGNSKYVYDTTTLKLSYEILKDTNVLDFNEMRFYLDYVYGSKRVSGVDKFNLQEFEKDFKNKSENQKRLAEISLIPKPDSYIIPDHNNLEDVSASTRLGYSQDIVLAQEIFEDHFINLEGVKVDINNLESETLPLAIYNPNSKFEGIDINYTTFLKGNIIDGIFHTNARRYDRNYHLMYSYQKGLFWN